MCKQHQHWRVSPTDISDVIKKPVVCQVTPPVLTPDHQGGSNAMNMALWKDSVSASWLLNHCNTFWPHPHTGHSLTTATMQYCTRLYLLPQQSHLHHSLTWCPRCRRVAWGSQSLGGCARQWVYESTPSHSPWLRCGPWHGWSRAGPAGGVWSKLKALDLRFTISVADDMPIVTLYQ